MVNLSLVYLLAGVLFENNNVFYIYIYKIYIIYLMYLRVQCLPIFRQIFVTKFGRETVSLEFGSLSKKYTERICTICVGNVEEYRSRAFRLEKNIFKFNEGSVK